MAEHSGIRQTMVALRFVALLACAGVPAAHAAQSRSAAHAGHSAAASAKASDSSPEAAAYQKLNNGQVDEAAAAFQAILAAHPNDPAALAGMGQVRMLQGNYLGAVSFLEQAKQASPNDATIAAALDSARFQFLVGEGKDAQAAKDNEDAEKRFREALELRPDAREAVNALVNVLVLENKLADAQDMLSSTIAHEAAATGHPPEELEMQLAQLDIANNQPQLAYPIFLQVLQDAPERADAWSGLLSSLHLMGHDADAIAQEKVIPGETRAQLEATPGFAQMMSAMANAPALAATNGPSYAPYVPSAAQLPAPAPAASAAPAASVVATEPPPSAPRHIANPAENPSTKPNTPRSAVAPAHVPAVSRPVAAAPVESTRVPPAAAQTATSTRAASSASSGAPLVTQPAARPAVRGQEIPDTGEQQYPQPKIRPRPSAGASNSSSAPAQSSSTQ